MVDQNVAARVSEAAIHVAVQRWAAVSFVVIGLSHLLQPRAWAEFFVMLRAKGAAGNFVNAFLSLAVGALIVGFHNVWSGASTVLTVVGWAQVLKGALYFCAPAVGLRSIGRVRPEAPGGFAVAGAVLLALGCVVGWTALT
jgi:hypothetical protein